MTRLVVAWFDVEGVIYFVIPNIAPELIETQGCGAVTRRGRPLGIG